MSLDNLENLNNNDKTIIKILIDNSHTFYFQVEYEKCIYKIYINKKILINESSVFKSFLEDDVSTSFITINNYDHYIIEEVMKYLHKPDWCDYTSKYIKEDDKLYNMIKFCVQYDFSKIQNILQEDAMKYMNSKLLFKIGFEFNIETLKKYAIKSFVIDSDSLFYHYKYNNLINEYDKNNKYINKYNDYLFEYLTIIKNIINKCIYKEYLQNKIDSELNKWKYE